jgi:hypothetical protein
MAQAREPRDITSLADTADLSVETVKRRTNPRRKSTTKADPSADLPPTRPNTPSPPSEKSNDGTPAASLRDNRHLTAYLFATFVFFVVLLFLYCGYRALVTWTRGPLLELTSWI